MRKRVWLLALAACGGEPAAPITVASVTLTAPAGDLASGSTLQLTARVVGSDGNTLTGRVLAWSSSAPAIASVDNQGLVTAAVVRGGSPESVTITASTDGRSGTVSLQVLPVAVAALAVTPAASTLRVGEQRLLAVTARDATQQLLTGRAVSWSSSQPSIASVDAGGVVRALAPGTARIEARAEGVAATADVTVPVVPALIFTVDAPPVTQRGDRITLAWQSAGVASCDATGAWSGARSVAGTTTITLDTTGLHSFDLRCTGPGGDILRTVGVTARRPVSRQSYDNFKGSGVLPSSLPVFFGTTGYGDFLGTGTSALLSAELRYSLQRPIEEATRSLLGFWTMRPDRTWQPAAVTVTAETPSCVHPRKVLVTEVNGDRRPDLLVLCHGYDAVPFRGELNLSLLSQPDGSYRQRALSLDSAFYHGGATCDLDGDGGLDLITADGQRLQAYEIRADGGMRARPTHPLSSVSGGGLYSVECLDVNEDGRTDVVFGGHEPGMPNWVTPTRIWFGQPGGTYREAIVPGVPSNHIVLDFTVTGTATSRTLWVLRTSGGDGTFYVGNVLQRVDITTMNSSVAFSSRSVVQLGWVVPYTRDGALYIGAESTGLQPGSGARIGWEYRLPP